jgi:hypothetical protein
VMCKSLALRFTTVWRSLSINIVPIAAILEIKVVRSDFYLFNILEDVCVRYFFGPIIEPLFADNVALIGPRVTALNYSLRGKYCQSNSNSRALITFDAFGGR